MGRNGTGAITIHSAKEIKVSRLVKAGFIKKGEIKFAGWRWTTNGVETGRIWIITDYDVSEPYIWFIYTHTTRDDKRTDLNYKVKLLERPSNLGLGHVLFFQCPVSFKPCRTLYLAYDSTIFKSREAYKNRIYYPLQTSSKLDRANDQYWQLENQINQLGKGRAAYMYAGKYTRRYIRMYRLLEKQEIADYWRWHPSTFPKGMRLSFDGFEDFDE